MQFQRNFGLAMMVLFTAGCLGCTHSQPVTELQPNKSLAVQDHSATSASPSPDNTAVLLPPNARLFPVSEGVILGSAIQKVQPEYPLEAQAKGITGMVRVEITVNASEGKVVQAKFLDGPPLLREPALQAAWQWRFKPANDLDWVYAVGTVEFKFPPL